MDPNTILFCRLDGSTLQGREQRRLLCLEESGLLSLSSPPLLRELLETATNLLDFPLAWIGLMELNVLRLQCTLGLSELGLTHNLSQQRSLPRLDSFCTYVVDSEKALIIEDTFADPVFAESPLAHTYGIRSYLGAPLIWTNEEQECYCLGTIALMDRTPRRLLPSDRQWIQVLSRWCMSEYGLASAFTTPPGSSNARGSNEGEAVSLSEAQIRLQTIHDLTQSCHNPMTAILGMTRMLEQEIYGSLTPKQREYVEVIGQSSQTLLLQAQEIQSLSTLPKRNAQHSILPTDLGLVAQNLIQQLTPIAQENNIDLDFSTEPTEDQWYGDPEQIRQILNHLLQGVITLTQDPGTLHLHLSYPPHQIKFTLWFLSLWVDDPHPNKDPDAEPELEPDFPPPLPLRLTYCKQLVEKLKGTFTMESPEDMGKRYTVILPQTES
ncbi:MAG: sensor histidine kinase [Prochlorotrichaceae cyanobacterium]